jgi:hypothetical protein
VRRSFLASLDVTDEAPVAAAPVRPTRISVGGSFVAGWKFLFTKGHRLAARLWLPTALLALWDMGGLGAGHSGRSLLAMWLTTPDLIITLALNAILITGAYSLAEGMRKAREPDTVTLAELRLGVDDLHVFLAKLALWLVVIFVGLGAVIIGRQILSSLSGAGFLVQIARQAGEGGVQWAKDLNTLAWVVLLAPISFAAIILTWLATRYALVFAHIIAVGRLKLFDALAFTKGNSWRILLLWAFLALSIVIFLTLIAFGLILIAEIIRQDSGTLASAGDGMPREFGHALKANRPANPDWLLPYVPWALAAGTLVWQSVFAGAFSHAYRRVTGAA